MDKPPHRDKVSSIEGVKLAYITPVYKKEDSTKVKMDLSRAFDAINHELLMAKLHAYGFGKNALDLVYSYLKNRKQTVKINMTFSTWTDLISSVP